MSQRSLLHFVFAALLLVTQLGAITHSVWHLRDYLPAKDAQDQAGTQSPANSEGQTPQSKLCDQHAALGTLLAGDCPSPPATLPTAESHWLAAAFVVWRVAQATTTPPSRAPPVLL